MKITRVPLVVDSNWYSAEWDVPRAAGCHLMQVVDYMEQQLGIVDPARNNLPAEALEWYRFGGYMIEHLLARHAVEVECQRDPSGIIRPGACMWCQDCDIVIWTAEASMEHCATYNHHGIHGTPDAMMTVGWYVREWKCTWKTNRRAGGDGDEDNEREPLRVGIWRWPTQTQGYVYLTEANGAQLDAMFINGNYAPPAPSGDSYLFEFDGKDVEQNWSSVVSYARRGGMIPRPVRIGVGSVGGL